MDTNSLLLQRGAPELVALALADGFAPPQELSARMQTVLFGSETQGGDAFALVPVLHAPEEFQLRVETVGSGIFVSQLPPEMAGPVCVLNQSVYMLSCACNNYTAQSPLDIVLPGGGLAHGALIVDITGAGANLSVTVELKDPDPKSECNTTEEQAGERQHWLSGMRVSWCQKATSS